MACSKLHPSSKISMIDHICIYFTNLFTNLCTNLLTFFVLIQYIQGAPNVWNFVLSAPNTNAYIGIGFSPNGNMVGSSAIVGWFGADGTSDMRKYFLGG